MCREDKPRAGACVLLQVVEACIAPPGYQSCSAVFVLYVDGVYRSQPDPCDVRGTECGSFSIIGEAAHCGSHWLMLDHLIKQGVVCPAADQHRVARPVLCVVFTLL